MAAHSEFNGPKFPASRNLARLDLGAIYFSRTNASNFGLFENWTVVDDDIFCDTRMSKRVVFNSPKMTVANLY
jgi:hypothetical protein